MDFTTYQEKFLKEFYEKNIGLSDEFRRALIIPSHVNINRCPDCGAKTKIDRAHGEIYCQDCGLIVRASIMYVGNMEVVYPYGLLL